MKIYLAGPDVFRNEAIKYLNGLKLLSKKHGHIGLAPLDNTIQIPEEMLFSQEHGTEIFQANVELIEECDVIIANIEPFRGAGVDDGTAWEIGYGYAKGKKIYGYSEFSDMSLSEITELMFDIKKQSKFSIIESFGKNTANLMIVDSIRKSGGNIFKTFEECLVDLNYIKLTNYSEKILIY